MDRDNSLKCNLWIKRELTYMKRNIRNIELSIFTHCSFSHFLAFTIVIPSYFIILYGMVEASIESFRIDFVSRRILKEESFEIMLSTNRKFILNLFKHM